MINLKFKINKHHLLVHALRQRKLPFPEWVNLQNEMWAKYPDAYYLLFGKAEVAFMRYSSPLSFKKIIRDTERLLDDALKSKEFKRLHKETKAYLKLVQNQWAKNKEVALSFLEKSSGLKMPNKTITVLITYPKLQNGFADINNNVIGWGHSEDWKNYTTVYLCHEIMHFLTKNTPIMHALIELMTDNELRIKLNKTGKYNLTIDKKLKYSIPPYRLKELELRKKLYKSWKDYLKNKKGRNIIDLADELKEKKSF